MERRSRIILPAVFSLPSLSASRLGPTAILQPQFYLPSSSIQYSPLDSVGQGASATVFKGKYFDKVVAIKKYAISNPRLPASQNLLAGEAAELLKLDHKNILKCYGVCLEDCSLILEFCSKTIAINEQDTLSAHSVRDLLDILQDQTPYDYKVEAVYQTILGLDYLHSKGIVHGDLKSANVLVTGEKPEDFVFKLCDLGKSHATITTRIGVMSSTRNPNRTKAGTVAFEAPEVFTARIKTVKSDIYSLAIMIYELLHPLLLFPWQNEFESVTNRETITALITQAVKCGTRPTVVDPASCLLSRLMVRCWDQIPENRPTANEVMKELGDSDSDIQDLTPPQSRLTPTQVLPKVSDNSPLKLANRQANQTRLDLAKKKLFQEGDENVTTIGASVVVGSSRVTVQPMEVASESVASPKIVDNFMSELDAVYADIAEYTEAGEGPGPGSLLSTRLEPPTLQLSTNIGIPDPPTNLVMTWSGFASTKIKVVLKPFQIQALNVVQHLKRDAIVIQATGSGKSVCFQVFAMMMDPGQYMIVIVPTVALGQDLSQSLKAMDVSAVFFSSGNSKEDYTNAFGSDVLDADRTAVIISTPECFLGDAQRPGFLKYVEHYRLKLIVLDEVHLIYEWQDFRESFQRIATLKHTFPAAPILALSATLKPSSLHRMQTDVMRDPVIIKGCVDRTNVAIIMTGYQLVQPTSAQPAKKKKKEDSVTAVKDPPMTLVAKKIINIVGKGITIVYCSYAKECAALALALCQLNVKSTSYTGKDTSFKDKFHIYQQMKAGDIEILVATKAFGLGINLLSVKFVIHFGIPENISLFSQEIGRAGRGGQQASGIMLINDAYDTKRLSYWLKDLTDPVQRAERMEDFSQVFQLMAEAFAGKCMRLFISNHFEDDTLPLEHAAPELCCSGCIVASTVPFVDVSIPVTAILSCVNVLHIQCSMEYVYESKIISWMQGEQGENSWVWENFNSEDLAKESSWACMKGKMTKIQAELTVKGLVRQALSKSFLKLEFRANAKGNATMHKVWILTDEGRAFLEQRNPILQLPEPVQTIKFLHNQDDGEENDATQKKKPRAKKGEDMKSRIIKLMSQPESWIPLTNKEQYEFVGYYHDTDRLLFIQDQTKLKSCPSKPSSDFIYQDVNLSKGQAFLPFTFEVGGVKFVCRRAPCAGVMVCPGLDCKYAVTNNRSENRCFDHPAAGLVKSAHCATTLTYISPVADEKDHRRWIGLFTVLPGSKAVHGHPIPVCSKLGKALEEDIVSGITNNPTLTPSDLHQGKGLTGGYNPTSRSLAAANKGTIENFVRKYRTTLSGAQARAIIEEYPKLIKNKIDERDSKVAQSKEFDDEILRLTNPYLRFHDFSEDGTTIVVFMTPQMLEVLVSSLFLQADVTFPRTKAFPYLLNIVAYNELSREFQVVCRVFLTGLSAQCYSFAFKKAMEIATSIHPSFDFGKNVKVWMVDFSLAQRSGLLAAGVLVAQIRGCLVHWQRNGRKIADRVAKKDTRSHAVFLIIVNKIPGMETEDDVNLAFDVLTGVTPLTEIAALASLSEEDTQVDTSNWHLASNWAKWWSQLKVGKMFVKCLKEMTAADYAACPMIDSNAAESHNKKSNSNTSNLVATLEHYCVVDKNSAYNQLAASMGAQTGILPQKRALQTAQRRKRRYGVRMITNAEEEIEDSEADETESSEAAPVVISVHQVNAPVPVAAKDAVVAPTTSLVRKSKRRMEAAYNVNSAGLSSQGRAISTTAIEQDQNIGLKVWIKTVENGKDYGFCEAIITGTRKTKDDKVEYVAKYCGWKGKYGAIISDLYDESEVKIDSPTPIEIQPDAAD